MQAQKKHGFGFIKFEGQELDNGYTSKMPVFQFVLVSLLFPMWGAAASLNDILITQFKSIFQLSNLASAYVQSAFSLGYFLMDIPASWLIKRTSYKLTIIIGLLLYLIGCVLFFPASAAATYGFFLAALFVLATGLTVIETAADTDSALLGPEKQRTLRLNISQTFLPFGSIAGILLGKYLIFSGGTNLDTQLSKLSGSARIRLGEEALQKTLQPYKYIVIVIAVMIILFLITEFPSGKPKQKVDVPKENLGRTVLNLLKNHNFTYGMFTLFMYVGLQVSVWSFTIRLALDLDHSINERTSSNFVIGSYVAFFIGRILADYLMRKIPHLKVLLWYSVLGFIAIGYMMIDRSFNGVYVAILVSGLMGPGYATIYTETLGFIKDPHQTETAGAMLVMMVVGGGVWPAIQGYVADVTGSMTISFAVHFLTFGAMIVYAYHYIKHPFDGLKEGAKNDNI
ncbi:sugar MFS transporter [Lentilactobacillus sp. SPB1-3]|uniref:Sugar MFS transporter n=1 Tax=Lentilactobacillus terminaliae TaxID=3003483 RepID=A0ACD5DF55_9LACO|nr:sugar MFS transporter [Lentilactobacillus sp. SPB1-3]MCZ0976411.1 sugar MFS transporter [Lentilactobacillus sp. SPB1-3]